jgi:hypothetical protein
MFGGRAGAEAEPHARFDVFEGRFGRRPLFVVDGVVACHGLVCHGVTIEANRAPPQRVRMAAMWEMWVRGQVLESEVTELIAGERTLTCHPGRGEAERRDDSWRDAFLHFSYAFHTLMFKRIGLKCDARNKRSRAAIPRLGTREEGTPRRKMAMHDGFIRYTDYFILVAAR